MQVVEWLACSYNYLPIEFQLTMRESHPELVANVSLGRMDKGPLIVGAPLCEIFLGHANILRTPLRENFQGKLTCKQ